MRWRSQVGEFVMWNIWWTFPAIKAALESRQQDFREVLTEAVIHRATRELQAAGTEQNRLWKVWLQQSDVKGFRKAIQQWLKSDCYSTAEIRAGETVVIGDTAVHLLHQRWATLWDAWKGPEWICKVEQELPDITEAEVRSATKDMSYTKSQGADGWTAVVATRHDSVVG
eukprot:150626-Amphidinium_carterae.1